VLTGSSAIPSLTVSSNATQINSRTKSINTVGCYPVRSSGHRPQTALRYGVLTAVALCAVESAVIAVVRSNARWV